MRNIILAAAALLSLAATTPVLADATGTTAGAAAGATAGFFIAGPIGAVIGGVIGAGTGDAITSDDEDYVRTHQVDSITYDGDIRPGYRVGQGLHVYAVPNDDRYSYVYVNGRPVVIDNKTQAVVWVGK
jgi:hypothetical protein